MILLNIQNLNLKYGEKQIFNAANLTLRRGDKVGIIGRNGSGKSTLLKIIDRQITPDISTPPFSLEATNEVIDGRSMASTFYVPQELPPPSQTDIKTYPLEFFPELLVAYQDSQNGDDLKRQSSGLEKFEHAGGWKLLQAYETHLRFFQLGELDRSFSELSGGEKRKIALALGLSVDVEIVLWDEPTNHLDLETVVKFEKKLLQATNTFLMVTHDRVLINETVNQVFHLTDGEVNKFEGNLDAYFEYLEEVQKQESEQLERMKNKLRRETAWMRQGIKARGTRSKKRVQRHDELKEQVGKRSQRQSTLSGVKLDHSGRKSKTLLEMQGVAHRFGERTLFEDVNLEIWKGNKIGILGRNGSGKTTLLQILTGKLQPTSGALKPIHDLKIAYFEQMRNLLKDDQTPTDLLCEAENTVILANGDTQHINGYLQRFLFNAGDALRPFKTFSGGEKNRIQLAYFLRQSADLWIFDEPTNDLDLESISLLEGELSSYPGAMILISHDRQFLENATNQIWMLEKGRVELITGGYGQIAQEYESRLKETPEKPVKSEPLIKQQTTPPVEKKRATNAQKMRWKVVHTEIEQTEKEIEEVEAALASFDYSNPDTEKLEELNNQNAHLNSQLEALIEEWGELEEIFS